MAGLRFAGLSCGQVTRGFDASSAHVLATRSFRSFAARTSNVTIWARSQWLMALEKPGKVKPATDFQRFTKLIADAATLPVDTEGYPLAGSEGFERFFSFKKVALPE